MGFEIDFLAVGEGEHGGDAIVLRYGQLFGRRDEQFVAVIDGGFADTGKVIIDHLDRRYHTDSVDLVISTHPDSDHINGLKVVVDELSVGQLWMHLPESHSIEMAALKAAGWRSATAFREKLERSLQSATDLEDIAHRRGVPITEPFAGLASPDNGLLVVGPTRQFYESLLPEFRTYAGKGLAQKMLEAIRGLVPETIWVETLEEGGQTSPENNSCVITLMQIDGRRILLTADVGIPALDAAMDQLEAWGMSLGSLDFVQIPHHGSKRNVSPSILDRLLGPKGQSNTGKPGYASSPPDGLPKHPAKKVTNAFRRRGWDVAKTAGQSILYRHDAPPRPDYGPIDYVPFFDQVDE